MPKVKMTPELKNRLEVLAAQYETAAAFADALGVEESTIRRWKSGSREMPLTAIKLLACLEKEKLKRSS